MTTNDQVKVLREAVLSAIKDMEGGHDPSAYRTLNAAIVAVDRATERAATQPAGEVVERLTQFNRDFERWHKTHRYADRENARRGWEAAACHYTRLAAPISEDTGKGAPPGFALIPLKMSRAMREVTDEEGWQWEDLLAAAESITEEQYNKLVSEPTASSEKKDYCGRPGTGECSCRKFFADPNDCENGIAADRAARTPTSVGSEAKGEVAGSIGADPEFCRLAKAWGTWNAGLSDYAALVAYIDSRIAAAPERSGKAADEWTEADKAEQAYFDRWPDSPVPAGNSSAAPSDAKVDEIVTALYRRFKDWSKRGFGPDDVTWCEVKADVISLLALAATAPTVESLNAAIMNMEPDEKAADRALSASSYKRGYWDARAEAAHLAAKESA